MAHKKQSKHQILYELKSPLFQNQYSDHSNLLFICKLSLCNTFSHSEGARTFWNRRYLRLPIWVHMARLAFVQMLASLAPLMDLATPLLRHRVGSNCLDFPIFPAGAASVCFTSLDYLYYHCIFLSLCNSRSCSLPITFTHSPVACVFIENIRVLLLMESH